LVGRPTEDRVFYVAEAFRRGWTVDQVFEANKIDRWFLNRIRDIVMVERAVAECALDELSAEDMLTAKQFGLSDDQIAYLTGSDELTVRARRKELGVVPVFKTVDTCAAEFESLTEYHYKTYELGNSEVRPSDKKRAMILGAGPNRIGQGIEFDYCCVHASYALHDAGYETIMVNCNPETVSTDYDTSDRLYFEPLTYEDVMETLNVNDNDVPFRIYLYASDFKSKDQIVSLIATYNQLNPSKAISYTDYVGMMMNSVNRIVDAVTYILLGCISVSLVVSSIMIGIITYISVLERTKEIGILRSLGASNKDVFTLFNAETITLGLCSGLIGILATALINIPVNMILNTVTGVGTMISMTPFTAVILILISALLSFISGLIPSQMASKKNPVIALRSEG